MPLAYDPEAGYLSTAFRFSNTVVPCVLRRFEFWVFFGLHIAANYAFRNGMLPDASTSRSWLYVDWNEVKVVSAITTFFEVFYTNQCYSRYLRLYDLTRKMLGNLYDFSFELRLHLGKDCQSHARLASRWFTAGVLLFFYEMNSYVSEAEWEELLQMGLVKPEEKDFLSGFEKHQRSHIMLQLAGSVCKDGCTLAKTPANVLKSTIDKLIKTRTLEQEVVDTIELPIPFQYFHLLKMMVVVNLLLWAYGMAITESAFAPAVYFCSALIFMGMMELAAQLSDPFGEDEVDFPVSEWLNEFLESTVMLLEFKSPLSLEERLQMETPLQMGNRHLNLFVKENMAAHDEGSWFSGMKEQRRSLLHSHGEHDGDDDDGDD
mmetsp:Transcript_104747/g.337746  ORF Transcript_104747/g.337746 Transcript_104747/m.337746 type:complete len:375 (+) Transcript_104747:67-1191(+)